MNSYYRELPDGNWQFLENKESVLKKGYRESGAVFSEKDWENARYRYTLWRIWDQSLPRLCFIMLNCSRGNHFKLTMSSRYCNNIAKHGLNIKGSFTRFGSVEVVNLFAFRSPKPKILKKEKDDVVGPENNNYIKSALMRSKLVIVAWGQNGIYQDRDLFVLNLIKEVGHKPYRIEVTSDNFPYHPSGILINRYRLFKPTEDELQFVDRCFGEYLERPIHHNSSVEPYVGNEKFPFGTFEALTKTSEALPTIETPHQDRIIKNTMKNRGPSTHHEQLILIAESSPIKKSLEPPDTEPKTIARIAYEVLAENPYKFTEIEFFKEVHIVRRNRHHLNIESYQIKRSPLCQSYGWGIHRNAEQKYGLVACESKKYQDLKSNPSVKKIKCYRKSKA